MAFQPHFLSTIVGSFPQPAADSLITRLVEELDIPAWPQLPKRHFLESMYIQYSRALPALVVDEENEKVFFDTRGDLTGELESFYQRVLDDEVEAFALTPEYAAGFFALLEALDGKPGGWVKGQVTGPLSFGLTVTDQDLRASLYNDLLTDAIVKNAAMSARWQVQQLRACRPNAIVFVDEPYMASFGSAFISLSREQVVSMLEEVFAAIRQEGGVSGVHCCANTDWSVLLDTSVEILNLDAYGYLENLALYPAELSAFLERGGVIAWGIVPNNDEIFEVEAETLVQRLWEGLWQIEQKAAARGVVLDRAQLAAQSLVTPSCGLGSTTPEVAERALQLLPEVVERLREKAA